MGETTPGPLIMVLQFVGFLAAFREAGWASPLLAGTLGGLLATWVTFAPCFAWIFLGAPYIEGLRGNKSLGAALTAVTATVVGVILNLAVWFAIHVIFGRVVRVEAWPLSIELPALDSINWLAAVLAVLAIRRRVPPEARRCDGPGRVGSGWSWTLGVVHHSRCLPAQQSTSMLLAALLDREDAGSD